MPIHGTHRIKNSDGEENGVWITDGSNSVELRESRYRARGYKPAVEDLPWEHPSGNGVRAPQGGRP